MECAKVTDGAIWPHLKCHICKSYGHWKSACPDGSNDEKDNKKKKNEKEKDGNDVVQNYFSLWGDDPDEEYAGDMAHLNASTFCNTQITGASFSTTAEYKGRATGRLLILLDSGATHHIVCNSALLTDIVPLRGLRR